MIVMSTETGTRGVSLGDVEADNEANSDDLERMTSKICNVLAHSMKGEAYMVARRVSDGIETWRTLHAPSEG